MLIAAWVALQLGVALQFGDHCSLSAATSNQPTTSLSHQVEGGKIVDYEGDYETFIEKNEDAKEFQEKQDEEQKVRVCSVGLGRVARAYLEVQLVGLVVGGVDCSFSLLAA